MGGAYGVQGHQTSPLCGREEQMASGGAVPILWGAGTNGSFLPQEEAKGVIIWPVRFTPHNLSGNT